MLEERSRTLARVCAALAAAEGAVVLLAWRLGAPRATSLIPGLPPMAPNTAACLFLAGASLLALAAPRPGTLRRRAGRAAALAVAAAASATLLEYFGALSSRLDYLLIPRLAGAAIAPRASPYTALALLPISATLLMIDEQGARLARARDACALSVLSIAALALIGHGYGVEYLHTLPSFRPSHGMALLTALGLAVLAVGVLAARPETGVAAIVASERAGGLAARRLLVVALLVVPFLALSAAFGERAGVYPHSGTIAATLYSTLAVIVASALATARALDRIDLERERGAETLKRAQQARERLAAIVESSDDAVIGATLDGVVTAWNKGAERIFGFTAAEAVGKPSVIARGPRFEEDRRRNFDRIERGESVEPYDTERLRKDGTPVAVSLSASPILDESGKIIGVSAIVRDISERKRLESDLRRRTEELEDLYENAPCGYHSLDEDGLVVRMNATELSWLGYAREEVVGAMNITELMTPASRVVFRKHFPVFMERGQLGNLEFEFVRRDGTPFPVLVTATAIRDDHGRYVKSRSTVYDLTELKRAQRALEEARRFLSAIVENIPAMVVVKDARDLRLILCNKTGQAIIGRPREQLLGKTDHDLFPKEQADFFEAKDREAMANGMVDVPEEPLQTPAGPRYLHTRKIPLRDPDGNPTHLLLIAEDITERKKLAAETRRLAEERARVRFSLALESAASAMVMVGADGRIVFANAQAERLFGYAKEELRDQTVETLVPGRFRAAHPALRQGFFHGSVDQRPMGAGRNLYGVRKDGVEFPVEIGLTRVQMEEGAVVVASVVDISERARSDRALKESEARLRQSVEELEGFAYTISHNLRSPLRAVQGYAALVEQRMGPGADEESRNMLKKISGAALRLDRMIRDLLSYSAVSRGPVTLEAVDLDELVVHAVEAMHPRLASGVLRVHSPLGRVRGQSSLVLQIVSNLLENAVKFVPPGRAPRIEISSEAEPGAKRRLIVSDNGVGIPAEFRAKILEPFERLPHAAAAEGTGIGLAIVQKASRRMGGRVGIESEPGSGSRIWIELPEA